MPDWPRTPPPPPFAHLPLHGEIRVEWEPRSALYNTDGQIFSDVGIPVVLFMENYDIIAHRLSRHARHDGEHRSRLLRGADRDRDRDRRRDRYSSGPTVLSLPRSRYMRSIVARSSASSISTPLAPATYAARSHATLMKPPVSSKLLGERVEVDVAGARALGQRAAPQLGAHVGAREAEVHVVA